MKALSLSELLSRVRDGLMVRTHSAAVQPGDVFLALPGAKLDGGTFVSEALARGAAYVVASTASVMPEDSSAAVVVVPDVRDALGELAAAYFKTPEKCPALVGVTGTNGKTTVTYLAESLLAASGRRVGVIGTVSYRWPGFQKPAPLTTPDCWSLHGMLAAMGDASVDAAVMEVSSHAIDQKRVAGLSFDVAALTNLTQDHLDYHGDMETYFQAKARLFTDLPRPDKTCVVNYDDPYGRRLLEMLPGRPALAYGLGEPPAGHRALRGEILSLGRNGLTLRLTLDGSSFVIESPLVGLHNAQNLLTVAGIGLGLGLEPGDLEAMSGFSGVPGRLERVANSRGLDIFVDYAHTPDALENVQRALKALDFKRLIVVFGCGGNRDRTKRPLMGQAVARYADMAFLTSDNPRHEDPEAIMADVMPGLANGRNGLTVVTEVDRGKALELAVAAMEPGDALLVAGKGHEDYQIVGDEKRPFSDVRTIEDILG